MNFFRLDTFGVSLLVAAAIFYVVLLAISITIADVPMHLGFDALAGSLVLFLWLLLPYMLMTFCWPSEGRMRVPWSRIIAGVLVGGLALILWSGFYWDIYQHSSRVGREGPGHLVSDYDPAAGSNNMAPVFLPFLQLQIIGFIFICSYGLGKESGPSHRLIAGPRHASPKW